MKTKSIFTSKTVAVQAATIVAAFIPAVQTFVVSHPQEVLIGIGIANAALRWITKGRVSLFGD